jgi:serine/threonine protein kinase
MGACFSSCVKFILGIESDPLYEVIPNTETDSNDKQGAANSSKDPPTIQKNQEEKKLIDKRKKDASSYQAEFFKKYDLKEVIGVGSTGTCHRCIRKSDSKDFACKIIDKRQIEVKFTGLLDQFYVEIRVLTDLKHPNIIELQDVFETADRIFIIMEIMNGGELFDYVVEKGTLSEAEASVVVRKITSAIAHMHAHGIIHRDLKPENLLLTEKGPNSEVKIIDFGLAKVNGACYVRSTREILTNVK